MDYCIAKHRCRFHPGERFGAGLDSFIRLSFSYYGAADLAVGAQRLGEGMREMLAAAAAAPAPALAAAATPHVPRGAGAAPPRLAVHGASGRLGALVAAAAAAPGAAAAFAGAVATRGAAGAAGVPADAEVVVDVTLPDGTAALVAALAARPGAALPLVVGTTGELPMEALRAYAARAPVVLCANFSAGAPLLLALVAACGGGALPAGWHAEVSEEHHTLKRDAPSGTAKRVLGALAAAGVGAAAGPGAPVPCHTLRLGDTAGTHTVHLAGPGERVELRHTASRREVFAAGALRVAAWAAQQPPGLYVK